ncbi:MAG: DNA polymerase III subunit alpha, partial [Clostridia bacterium]|nr:DNA polymerase III subunit alpha [Clostridia bacterium]
ISQHILNNDMENAEFSANEYLKIFGKENFYIELQNHQTPDDPRLISGLVTIANKLGLKTVATNDVHYTEKKDSYYQDVLMCIQTHKTVTDTDRLKFLTNEFYLKSGEEMEELFSNIPEAIANTIEIADKCNVTMEFGKYHLPKFHLADDIDPYEYLTDLCMKGLMKRYGNLSHKDRLMYELETIKSMGFVDYFLIVWDFIRFAHSKGIPVGPGRGSAAGSLVSYCLGITGIDPVKYNLLFERFLNPQRVTMPDIDIDFCFERREEVFQYVVNKYGTENVGHIVAFGTLSARSVVRDVARAINVSYAKADAVAKSIPFSIGQTIDKALNESRQLKEMYDTDSEVRQIIDISRNLEGLPRHTTTHAAGVVITENPLSDYVPLQLSEDGVQTQFTMTTLEELGLLKMDFLGLRNLTIISDTVKSAEKNNNIEIDINKIDYNDQTVFNAISSGKTDGMFQLESAGMTEFMRRLKPRSLEDLIAGISLFRPGPADAIPTFIENKNNPQKVTYLHPILEDILKPTYGCIVYQEQVMQIVQKVAGYSLGRA